MIGGRPLSARAVVGGRSAFIATGAVVATIALTALYSVHSSAKIVYSALRSSASPASAPAPATGNEKRRDAGAAQRCDTGMTARAMELACASMREYRPA